MEIKNLCKKAFEVKHDVAKLTTNEKNKILMDAAEQLIEDSEAIIAANKVDMKNAVENNMPQGLQDRLLLTVERIEDMAEGVRQIANLDDPIGNVLSMNKRPNGLLIGKKVVPLGVVGVIYEARPNVTSDVFGLCLKTGNCAILKGGKDAINSNIAIVNCLKKALLKNEAPIDAVSIIEDTSREKTYELMKMNQYIDVLIPRGGKGLIKSVVDNSTIPVIETGTGNCHIYVDESADFDKAIAIIENAKTQRIGVCNAAESLVINKKIASEFLPRLYTVLTNKKVKLYVDEEAMACLGDVTSVYEATEEDWGMEYLDYKISVKVVESIEEAIKHINRYNTGHSEAIITENYSRAQKFLDEIDAACVYVNASTRFTDGNEFGFGAEIGISTQKIHARGPMGLEALTSSKYIIYGNGQIR
ncbi:glutamate-5-semialdehyde dehydrogenase [Lachnobacterium bovis]|uniref:Gamma-glutamyl phosphate reductase n=1 Tax=Lachnobacterium bovis TaxID=140626 RepID=A0A1H9QPB4_9FIRM|nr:glutamate-5-semialdehyde dehydrogenase [Lachnobacterium bovis]SER61679.1 glutamate-5-semialdehyde dehydrogenase [Lachnobacterium bovis]